MVYGYYYKTILSKPISMSCPNCGSKDHQSIDIRCKVSHCCFIPCIASGKEAVTACGICGKKYYVIEPNPLYNEAQATLKNKSLPWYYFTGAALFGIFALSFAVLMIWGSQENKERKLHLLDKAHAGYTILQKLDNGDKTCMLITDVRNDSVFVRENRLSTNKNVYDINELENFSNKITSYTFAQLQEMIDNGSITDIVQTTLYFDLISKKLENKTTEE